MKLWQCNRYIPVFGYKFYYKQFFLWKIAKPLGLSCFYEWKKSRNKRRRKYGRTKNAYAKINYIKKIKDCRKCYVCKKEFTDKCHITLEHIIPKSVLKDKKLYDNKDNWALSHYYCNQLKANKLLTNPTQQG